MNKKQNLELIRKVRHQTALPKTNNEEWEEEIIKKAVLSLEDVYGFLRKYREPDIINAFRERFKQKINQFFKSQRQEAYEQGKTDGLDLRKNYTDIKPEIIKKERREAVEEVLEKIRVLYSDKYLDRIVILNKEFYKLKQRYDK